MYLELVRNEPIVERLQNAADPLNADEIAMLADDTWRENRWILAGSICCNLGALLSSARSVGRGQLY